MTHYTADELRSMPTLAQGQADDLKIDDGTERIWLSRMTREDGSPFDAEITVERLIDGRWEVVENYEGGL